MKTIPIEKVHTPSPIIDELITSFGFSRVAWALVTRLFRRTRPPDETDFPGLADQPGLNVLSDHLRRDLGLPPERHGKVYVDPVTITKRDMF